MEQPPSDISAKSDRAKNGGGVVAADVMRRCKIGRYNGQKVSDPLRIFKNATHPYAISSLQSHIEAEQGSPVDGVLGYLKRHSRPRPL